MTHNFKHLEYLHQALYYNQIGEFVFSHDHEL
jgi:hypothetical protein